MALTEATAATLTPDLLKQSLIENGAILVRGFAHTPTLAEIKSTLENEMDKLARVPPELFEKGQASDDPVEANYWLQLSGGRMSELDFRKIPGNHLSFFDAVPRALEVLHKAFPDYEFEECPLFASFRRVLPLPCTDSKHMWDRPIPWHVDAQYHRDQVMQVNVWTPLEACGHFAPGLQVITAGIARTLEYLGYKEDGYPKQAGDHSQTHKFIRERFFEEHIREHFSDADIAKPTFAVGDVLLLSNYTLHMTSFCYSTHRPRISVEARFDAAKRPF